MTDFHPGDYWENRLKNAYDETGVGRRGWGVAFNRWAYRARRKVFDRTLRGLHLDLKRSRAVDIGSGTGVYIQALWENGVRAITGVDLTDVAVTRLRDRFTEARFARGDIGDASFTIQASAPKASHADRAPEHADEVNAGADIVTCMDVMFHIVDDARYRTAIGNLHDLLLPGGVLIMTDGFLSTGTQRLAHIVHRDAATIDGWFADAGFERVLRRPFLVLMNDPIGKRRPILRTFWKVTEGTMRRIPGAGHVIAPLMYVPETVLARVLKRSPSTHICVYRRRP